MPDLLLTGDQPETTLLVLESILRHQRRDQVPPSPRLRELVAVAAMALPELAVQLREVLRTISPETVATVKAQAARLAGNAAVPPRPPLGASEAALIADVDARTIRAAAAAGRLAARKDQRGEWRISAAELDRWMGARNA